MSTGRRQPPRPIRRALRHEAGFGCCVCGHPIFEYHHIVPLRVEHHFRPEDMMILCPNHHGEAGALVIDEAAQREHKRRPYNVEHGYATGQLHVDEQLPRIHFGKSVEMVGAGPLIVIDGETLLGLAVGPQNNLLLSVALYSRDDELLARIEDNEWITGDPRPWDLDFKYSRLSIRNAPREIALEIDARKVPVNMRAELGVTGSALLSESAGSSWLERRG